MLWEFKGEQKPGPCPQRADSLVEDGVIYRNKNHISKGKTANVMSVRRAARGAVSGV